MNEYEQERLANIAKNEALLKEIGLTGIKPIKPKSATPVKKSTPKRNGTPKELVPRRTSSRLSGLPADSEIAKRKTEEIYEAQAEKERQKRMRVEGPLQLSQVIQGAGDWTDAQKLLSDLSKVVPTSPPPPEASETPELKALRKEFAGLRMLTKWEANQIKITPERIYSMEMHPGEKRLAFAGDKVGYLGVWDIDGSKSTPIKHEDNEEDDDVEVEEPAIHHFKLHSRAITSMVFDPKNAGKLYTSSQDASIRCLDLATGVSDEIFASQTDQAVTGLQLHPEGNLLYFSTVIGEVGIRDVRVGTRNTSFHHLHDRKIGAIGMHPGNPNLIVTSSLDRTMRVWDFRKIEVATRTRKLPESLATHTASLSVSSAFFNSAGSIIATSYDNSLKVFHHESKSWPQRGSIEPDVTISHNNTTGRWLTIFKAAWQQTPADGVQKFVVGNMKRKMDVFDAQGQILTQLENEYMTAVPAVVAMHPSQNWVIGGNASGRALFFS